MTFFKKKEPEVTPFNLRQSFVKSVSERLDKDAEAKRRGYARSDKP